ncbi:twin-arginine translocase TatA/TatE family subunit [Paracoccaceae bacterium Fryx2]|nr:twin-arginine translocase TatA/TatE family subunit [Paracoccaceae bacterium Fryx2]
MFHNIGPMGLVVIALVVLVLFGRGRVASLMGEVGNGISGFRREVRKADEAVEGSRIAVAQTETAAEKRG